MTTLRQAIQRAAAQLADHSPSPRLDAEALLAHVLGVSRAYLLAESQRELTDAQEAAFQPLVARRSALEPIAYLTGHKEFYGLDFVVDRRVLVPRPETELLVDLALSWAARRAQGPDLTIADIGTGSGCIAVTLAHTLPESRVFAVDLSADALDVARINVQRHGVTDRVALLHGAGCDPLPQPVTLIVSNPPYTVLSAIDENVRRWEPHLALDGGGAQGFDLPAQLLRQIPRYLATHGAVLMELGAWQGDLARQAAAAIFAAARITLHQDLAGHDRVLMIET
ncbi:MAG TPA: peptide chain release factor N(5)-glutamine methyltransferase [Herpetosiphonaceae bacterium]